MNIINFGDTYQVYGESLTTYDKLPVGTYMVNFAQNQGFFLEKVPDLVITESKVYGPHERKADKVLRSFKGFSRNLGVILSGNKGIGKSLFVRILSAKCSEQGIPTLLVSKNIVGIGDFIQSIQQEVLVVFDEFEKIFPKTRGNDNGETQEDLLSLFDGMSSTKHLYAITVNDFYNLNDYLLNRPGRFHYHIRFNYLSPDDIKGYLTDKMDSPRPLEVEKVIAFSHRVNLNYDCLRAIAYELNMGDSFEDAIQDLNILNLDKIEYFISIEFSSGAKMSSTARIDTFSKDIKLYIGAEDDDDWEGIALSFSGDSLVPQGNGFKLPLSKVTLGTYGYDEGQTPPDVDDIVAVSFTRVSKEANTSFLL